MFSVRRFQPPSSRIYQLHYTHDTHTHRSHTDQCGSHTHTHTHTQITNSSVRFTHTHTHTHTHVRWQTERLGFTSQTIRDLTNTIQIILKYSVWLPSEEILTYTVRYTLNVKLLGTTCTFTYSILHWCHMISFNLIFNIQSISILEINAVILYFLCNISLPPTKVVFIWLNIQ